MEDLLNMTNNVINIVLKKEEDYYTYFYNQLISNNDVLYSSNVLAENLLHIDFTKYLCDEVKYIIDCAINLIKHSINCLKNKCYYSTEELKILDFSTLQILDIYSDILIDFNSDEDYEALKQIRKYYKEDENVINNYLQNNYYKSEFIKLIYIYSLINNNELEKGKEITYIKVDKKHPFFHMASNIEKKIIEKININK